MPYKIVQTFEKGRSVLTSIPGSWEKDGVLFWPKNHPEKLRINDRNDPQDHWPKSNCVLKRKHILSFEEAEREIKRMCDHSDTEQYADTENEDPCPAKQKKRQHKVQSTPFHNEDFNNLAQQCAAENYERTSRPCRLTKKSVLEETMATAAENGAKISTTSMSESTFTPNEQQPLFAPIPAANISLQGENYLLPAAIEATDELNNVNGSIYYGQGPESSTQESTHTVDITDKINNIFDVQLPVLMENQNVILNNQRLLSENQNSIILKLAQLGTQIDEIIKRCSHSVKECKEIDFKIIESPEEAEMLEMKLKDTLFKAQLQKNFSLVCGKERGKGINNAYVLIDLIFSRHFLKQCSWAGGSRNEESKICFRAFTRIFDFFFDLVRVTDNNFTKEDCKTFLKNILRNSVARCNSKQVRASTTRIRPQSIKRKLKTAEVPDEAPLPLAADLPNQYAVDLRESDSSNEGLC